MYAETIFRVIYWNGAVYRDPSRGICSFMGTSPAGFSISITEANDVKVGRWSVETLLRPGPAQFVNKSFKVILPWDYLVSFYKLKSVESFYYLDICE